METSTRLAPGCEGRGMAALLTSIAPAIAMATARLAVGFLLGTLQVRLLGAFWRAARSMELRPPREKALVSIGSAFLLIVNLPLLFFMIESVFSPFGFFLYT